MTDPQGAAGDTGNVAPRFIETLRVLERLPLHDLVMAQARLLEKVVRHARFKVPYYEHRLDCLFDTDDILDLSRWQDVPVLSTQEARAQADALRARAVPNDAGTAIQDRTSGSGGEVFHFFRSEPNIVADSANSLRIFRDYGFDQDARFADIRLDVRGIAAYPEGLVRPTWSFGEGTGDYVILDVSTDIVDQVDWLRRMRPGLIFTWASNMRALALEMERQGEVLPLLGLATSAELSSAGVQADCRRVFGQAPVDILGAREIGIIAWRCHASPLYHFTAESSYCEVLRDDGTAAAPGESGRLVATSLYNLHMPFIRYATGDYVALADAPCPCGRSLPALSAILGRDRNRFVRPDGSRRFPAIPEAALDGLIGPLKWRLVQDAPHEITVLVDAPSFEAAYEREAQIVAAINRAFDADLRVSLTRSEPPQPGAPRRKRELFRSSL